ncbi:MAG: flagellar motor protein MotA [Alphaproteobacteria bacterium]|nr:flagellar motor protein MotA [Alphaproteobacteria bacterium]
MTNPRTYLTRMGIFLVLAAIAAGVLYGQLLDAFLANPAINGIIVLVLLFGLIFVFRQVLMLKIEVNWIESYRRHQPGGPVADPPHFLAPMAAMIGDRQGKLRLNTTSLRSILDGISARLDESRDISRYMIGLLIFLGLLGTFWGLLQTVDSVATVIAGLQVGGGDTTQIFNDLKSGLEAPLAGMGTAFSSSLFGLAGSLLLGFLDLQASAAQNRFYNDLEDWLSSATRVSSGGPLGSGDGDQSVPAYIQALLESTAESLDNLQRTVTQAESSRSHGNQSLTILTERLSTMTNNMRDDQELLVRMAENQAELRPILRRLAEPNQTEGFDETALNHIRNIDSYLARMLEDQVNGRNQMVQELRAEIRLLARTIAAALAEGEEI